MSTMRSPRHRIEIPSPLPVGFKKGQIFTPRFLASWVAMLLAEHLGRGWNGHLLDPACGDGALLAAASEHLPRSQLLGIDLDPAAAIAARTKLGDRAAITTADALLSRSSGFASSTMGKVGAVISNPPWGADLLHPPKHLRSIGYSLATGQFDSWSIFVELSLKFLEKKGIAAFILPDAIFSPEHVSTRRLLETHYSILFIARLGEGLFEGVYRGTVVLIVQNEKPATEHIMEVFRLSKARRDSIISCDTSLQQVRQNEHHCIPQKRFRADATGRWDIDVRKDDQAVLKRIESLGSGWVNLFVSGRGIELSKRGIVRLCNICGYAIPSPRKPRFVTCRGCGNVSYSNQMKISTIVGFADNIKGESMPFVVGEDIGRYSLSCVRRIKIGVLGIKYKNYANYSRERLLVRKTGIGLKATVTKRFAATNQVVFHYIPRNEQYVTYLYYVLGVLCSRVMFAYHLKKSGENEWRSHPYVTPKSLSQLPIPDPTRSTNLALQATGIATIVRRRLQGGHKSLLYDLEIEELVAGLYQLKLSDLEWVKAVICDAQCLEPMRELGAFNPLTLRSQRWV